MASKRECKFCGNFEKKEDGIVLNKMFFCNYDHAIKYGREQSVKQKEKIKAKIKKATNAYLRSEKDKLKSRSDWLREAQKEFNRYIRLRDHKDGCISCGRYHQGQYHAGHYKSVGSCPELRFEDKNCHKQCAPCNDHLSGNIVEYRKNLKLKIGAVDLEWLEGPHEPLKLTIDEIKEIKAKYRKMANELQKEIER